jgi:hypothetical protein
LEGIKVGSCIAILQNLVNVYSLLQIHSFKLAAIMRTYPLLLISLLIGACNEISFREPQPKGKESLTKIPIELQGSYLMKDDDGKTRDTLIISPLGYIAGHNPDEKMLLSDSLVLRTYKGYYFINLNSRPEWVLRVLQRQKNGDLLFLALDRDNKTTFNQLLKKLSTEIEIDSSSVNESMIYQIDPTPKQLVSFIKKGYFKKSLFTKIK